jgi:hypothetical protein
MVMKQWLWLRCVFTHIYMFIKDEQRKQASRAVLAPKDAHEFVNSFLG